jgi:hypothetical protein
MAEVRIVDIYNPLVFNGAVQEAQIELNAFVASGVMVTDPTVTQLANGPGNIGDLPFFEGLGMPQADGTNEPDYVTDNPAVTATPEKIASRKMIYRKAFMHRSWSTMDLAKEIALQDPLTAITNRVGAYWATNNQHRLIRSAVGVFADNLANDAGDMIFDIYSDIASPVAANQISGDAVISAKATMGDAAGALTAIAMHSVIYTRLQRQNLIVTELDPANQRIRIETYLGYRVVVDDTMPVVAGVNSPAYTTILFSANSWAYGQGTPETPSEVDRDPNAGNGGGQDILHTRDTNIIHPAGFEFTSASVAGNSPTYAELADAANWNRVYAERKNIGMAFLRSNG